MKRIVSTWLVVLLVGLGVASFLYAQGSMDPSKGQVAVEVLDSSGAVIQNAKVTLSGPTGSSKAVTDVRGQVVFYNLIPGTYSVKVEFEGFRTFEVQNLGVAASQRPGVQARLEPGSVNETVQVSENAVKIDTSSTTTGATISADAMANLPIARNVTALLSLSPGVVDGGGTGAANPSISGGSGLENQYIIDGVNATDTGFGAFGVWSVSYGSMGTGVNFDFVKEVQVKSGGFEAQYGQATGGIVNVVTNSGGNEIHGALYAYSAPGFGQGTYKQPNDVRTVSFLSETHGRSAYDFGVNIGGPLIKNRLFWYGSFNPSYRTTQRMAPKGFGLRSVGQLPWNTHNYNWVGKVNFELSTSHHVEGTAFGDPSRDPMGWHRGLVRDDTTENGISSLLYGTRNWAVKYNGLFGPKTLLNGQFAWNHTYFFETPGPLANAFEIYDTSSAMFSGGLGHLQNNQGDNKQYSFMLTRNLDLLGGHQIDLGYAYNAIQYANVSSYTGGDWPLFDANGIPSDMVGKPTYGGYFYLYHDRTIAGVTYPEAYRLVRGNYSSPFVTTYTAYNTAFVQDAWQINRHLTAKVGVRWEEQNLQGNITTYAFTGNWAPRLGFIIDPTGSRKTKLFGNYGLFFEKVPQDMAVRAMSGEMAYMNGYFTALPPTQETFIPGSKFSPYNTLPTVMAAGTKAGYQREFVAGAEHEFPGGVVVSARFIHRSLQRILEDISGTTVEANMAGVPQQSAIANPSMTLDIFQNPIPCTGGPNCNMDWTWTDPLTGNNYGPYLNTSGLLGSDGIPDTYPNPRRVYKAFELRGEKRFGNNWSFLANYRLAKIFGNYEGFFRNDNGQADPGITSLFDFMWSPILADQFKVGVLPTDRKHVANVYANYLFKSRLNIGLGWNIQSGAPLSVLDAHPDYGNAGEVPVGSRGIAGRTPVQSYTDIRADYRIMIKDKSKISLAADLFNILNQKTIVTQDQDHQLDGGTPNADFLKVLTYHRPFYSRFSVRFEF
jgi:hypothetical protein